VLAVRKAVRMIFRCDSHQSLHPEQAVVVGAAIRAAELAGATVHRGAWRSMNMQQVAGRTVGLAMAGGRTEPLVRRSTPLPCVERRIFSTFRDNQSELTLLVVEGESLVTAENKPMGRFNITGLTPAPAGAVDVEVIFEMNESGALSITARDLSTGVKTKSRFDIES
jgi:molecular chaperone DnaK